MSRFFSIFCVLCAGLLGLSFVSAWFPIAGVPHMIIALTACLLTVSLHCLIFAIFTGSGKDTRELVEDLSLDKEWVLKTKVYKRTIFPPALYAIMGLLVTAILGGASSSGSAEFPFLRWMHFGVATLVLYYNLLVMWKESRAVAENAEIMKRLNETAARVTAQHPSPPGTEPVELLTQVLEPMEWGTHVYALGKFLTFLGYNAWLPYIYFRYIMGVLTTPILPFVVLSLLFFAGGYYLRWRYSRYRPSAPLVSP